jgi:Exopolysaccharide biosynthesis protein
MGDQAQTYCIKNWVEKNFEDYQVIIFTLATATNFILHTIRKNINPDDMLFCHSGYHLTDLYREKDVYCKVAELFPDYKIIIFPQTVNFIQDKAADEKRVSTIFNNHKNITLLLRDEFSYETAQSLFQNCRLLLYPDIVTSLIGKRKYTNDRDGILFCLRNDIEAFYNQEQIQAFQKKFGNTKIDRNDTTITLSYRTIRKKRKEILENMFDVFSRYKVVITDRYHGTIFSLIAGTPVIVLSSTDHKLSSGVKWFPESFGDYVKFAHNLDEAYQLASEILQRNDYSHILPPYFEDNYYSGLKSKLLL